MCVLYLACRKTENRLCTPTSTVVADVVVFLLLALKALLDVESLVSPFVCPFKPDVGRCDTSVKRARSRPAYAGVCVVCVKSRLVAIAHSKQRLLQSHPVSSLLGR